jgi:hypothetical protein
MTDTAEIILITPTESTYNKYKDYRKEWALNNKEKINAYAREQYKRHLEKSPENRKKINERILLRYHKKKAEITPEEKKPRGRPKTKPEKEKKPLGRPRKYSINNSS